jgi:deoxyhypusine synthase
MGSGVVETIIGIGALVFSGYAWFLKRIISRVEEDAEKLRGEVDHIKNHYLQREEFKEFKDEIRSLLQEIRQDIKELGRK